MAADLGCTVESLITSKELRNRIRIETYLSRDIGRPTLEDIIAELEKPGRDPRTSFKEFTYAENIHSIEDPSSGHGTACHYHQCYKIRGFLPISAFTRTDSSTSAGLLIVLCVILPDIVSVRQQVTVEVLEVDLARNRISLAMKSGSKLNN